MMAICLEDDHTTARQTRKVEINREQGINNGGLTALVFRVKVDVTFVYHGCIR